ncbi:unnamed protein product [Brassica rapa]|uniref:Uncharacterized protein n=2 Tax=Brassica TaxID=3705 RepID=A0A3P5ZQJ3_BRACM|nr:unnamed protein product [Brassica napus]CAG7886758.1 unnamed protein product [Brassica rapa]CDY43521.1 BnaA01g07230D [Brassica napus]VDC74288.1 unnamed protein product [Brassica rapa]
MAKVFKTIRFIIVFLLMTFSMLSCEGRIRFTHTDCTSDKVDRDEKQLQDTAKRFVQMEKVLKKPRPGRYPARVEDHVNFFMESELFTFPTMMRNVEASLSRMR